MVELSPTLDALSVFSALSKQRHCVFLDSARKLDRLGRFSFVAADPFEVLQGNDRRTLARLKTRLAELQTTRIPELPPLQGGAIGFVSYDMAQNLERVPVHRFDEFQLPRLCMGLYDVVIAFDHQRSKACLISQGLPAQDVNDRVTRARRRAEQFLDWMDDKTAAGLSVTPNLNRSDLAPLFATQHAAVYSSFSPEQFLETVAAGIEYIHAGDVFQVNLAQRLICQAAADSVSLYKKLRQCNPAPFAGYFDAGEHQIVSASPERFLQVIERRVETRPIKGTRPRLARPEADLFSAAELAASGKDLAENVMIVDLMRNDLSRVCEDDSVRVSQLCELELYEHVQHLVSVVDGRLREDVDNVDLIERAFPGGSITGAPKIRAMEIIAELEPTARGAYCGSLGYLGFDGTMDLNILIRTITASQGWWQFPVGGGIVAQSDPASEFRETWTKAEGILQAVSGWTVEI